jgi:hypothetical protein
MTLRSALTFSVIFALSPVGCAGGHDGATEGAGADLSALPPPTTATGPDAPDPKPATWDGTGAKTTVKLGTDCTAAGHTACSSSKTATFQASAVEQALAEALTTQDQNVSAEAATYTEVPADFIGDLTAAAQKDAAFQLMFRSDGKSFDDSHGFGESLTSFETLKCSTVTSAKVASTVAKFHGVQAILADDQDDKAKEAATKFKAAIADAESALVNADAGAKLFSCDWDNHDDSDAGAILSVDAKTSTVRVLFVFNGG